MTTKHFLPALLGALRPLLFLSLAGTLAQFARAQGAAMPLLVRPLPSEKDGQTIELRTVGEAREAYTSVYLQRPKDATAVTRIFAHLFDAGGKVVPTAEITLTERGGTDAGANFLLNPPTAAYPQFQPAVLRVKGIESAGNFTLKLWAQTAEKPAEGKPTTEKPAEERLVELPATISVRRPVDLQWLGLNADRAVPVTTGRAKFAHDFELIAGAGATAEGIDIEFGNLTDEAGNPVSSAKWTMGSEKKETNRPYPLLKVDNKPRLDAPLAGIGNYQTTLTLVRDGERRPTLVKIVRTKPTAPTVALYGLSATRITSGPFNSSPVPVWMTVQETANQDASVTALTTSALILKNPQKGPAAARFEKAELVDKESGIAAKLPFALQPTQTAQLEMRFLKLVEPGEYTGTLLLTTGDGETVSKEFTLYLKQSAWWAGFWIFIGVAGSWLIRWYRNRVRPQLVQLENHQQLGNDAATLYASLPPLEPAEEQVWNNWRSRFDDLGRALDGDLVADADARLALLNHQLSLFPKWVTARRHVLELQTPAAPLTQIVQSAENYLNKISEQAGEFDTQQGALDGIDTQIAQARLTELDQRLAALVTAARAQRPNLSNAGRAALDQWLNRAAAGLVGELAARDQRLRQLRGDYAALLAEDLEATTSAASTPAGFSNDEWQALQNHISRLTARARQSAVTDPESALVSYYGAVDLYLRTASLKLQVAARALGRLLSAADALKAEAVVTRATTVLQCLDQADPDRVRASLEYRGAAADYAALPAPPPPGAAVGGVAVAVAPVGNAARAIDAATLPQSPAFGMVPAIRPRPPRRLRSLADRTWKRILLDCALQVLLLAVTVAVGLKLLWVDDQVWGGWTACLTALLWGLGLHQIGGQAFEGTTALLTRITK